MAIKLSKKLYSSARTLEKGKVYHAEKLAKLWSIKIWNCRFRLKKLKSMKVIETEVWRDPNGKFSGFRIISINPFEKGKNGQSNN